MQKILWILIILLRAFHFAEAQTAAQPENRQREVVVTIDDLPLNSLFRDMESKRKITQKLLASLTAYEVPAIGFVNESKL